jgi:hypothetical protein
MMRNRHPVDELADVRAELKTLQAREVELRTALLEEGADRKGVSFVARVSVFRQERLDLEAVKEHFGETALRPFVVGQEVRQVRLSAREV